MTRFFSAVLSFGGYLGFSRGKRSYGPRKLFFSSFYCSFFPGDLIRRNLSIPPGIQFSPRVLLLALPCLSQKSLSWKWDTPTIPQIEKGAFSSYILRFHPPLTSFWRLLKFTKTVSLYGPRLPRGFLPNVPVPAD